MLFYQIGWQHVTQHLLSLSMQFYVVIYTSYTLYNTNMVRERERAGYHCHGWQEDHPAQQWMRQASPHWGPWVDESTSLKFTDFLRDAWRYYGAKSMAMEMGLDCYFQRRIRLFISVWNKYWVYPSPSYLTMTIWWFLLLVLLLTLSQAVSRTQSGDKSRWFQLHARLGVPWLKRYWYCGHPSLRLSALCGIFIEYNSIINIDVLIRGKLLLPHQRGAHACLDFQKTQCWKRH